jgi:hypothetical protein
MCGATKGVLVCLCACASFPVVYICVVPLRVCLCVCASFPLVYVEWVDSCVEWFADIKTVIIFEFLI